MKISNLYPWIFDLETRYRASTERDLTFPDIRNLLPITAISVTVHYSFIYLGTPHIHMPHVHISGLTRLFCGSAENRLSTSKLSPHITTIERDCISHTSIRRSPRPFHRNLSWLLFTPSSSSPAFFLSSHLSLPFRIYIGAVERLRPQVRLYITEHVPARDMLHAVRLDLERWAKDAEGEPAARRRSSTLERQRKRKKKYVCVCVRIDLP